MFVEALLEMESRVQEKNRIFKNSGKYVVKERNSDSHVEYNGI